MIKASKQVVQFEEGDVVSLKSGGPKMTVFRVDRDGEGHEARAVSCVYFEKCADGVERPAKLLTASGTLELAKGAKK